MMKAFEANARRGGTSALREVSRFFAEADAVYESLRQIAERLERLHVSYAVVGGMALVAHGYRRTTEDVNVLVTPEGLRTIHESLIEPDYRPVSDNSDDLRDTKTGVRIEFVISGQYPGDGKPKPVALPDPLAGAVEIDGVRYANLPTLIQLKLASGMSSPGRLRDLADVQELIRVLNLPDTFADNLHPYVRDKFAELAAGVRGSPDDEKESA